MTERDLIVGSASPPTADVPTGDDWPDYVADAYETIRREVVTYLPLFAARVAERAVRELDATGMLRRPADHSGVAGEPEATTKSVVVDQSVIDGWPAGMVAIDLERAVARREPVRLCGVVYEPAQIAAAEPPTQDPVTTPDQGSAPIVRSSCHVAVTPRARCAPSAPVGEPDPHEYWCASPEGECNCPVGKSEMITSRQNDAGAWMPAIPLPYQGLRKRCDCGRRFWTMAGYRGHYALVHILEFDR